MLVTDIIGENVKTVNSIPLVEEMNQNPFRPDNPSDWVIEAGTVTDGIIEKIKQSLMYKFQETDLSLDKYRKELDAIICYARMVKVMSFKYPFESIEWNFNANNEIRKVSCFGISKRRSDEDKDLTEMQQQVAIYDYRNPDDFIVTLATADPSMEIILAKIAPGATLESAVTRVNERMERSIPEDFSNIDEIMIPKINLKSEKTYQELISQFLANKGFEDYFFAEAKQEVEFILDESGALAKVTGEIVKIKGPTSRIYAFDKPFLVICRDKGSEEPDIVAWIADTDVMHRLP